MNIPFRTRRMLNRVGTVALAVLLIGAVGWMCWVVWLQRYVVYTDDGAMLDFSRSANEVSGVTPQPPKANSNISIYYNEGANAVDIEKDMEQISGYYITNDMVKAPGSLDKIILQIERLDAGTAVMIDMKGPFGSFFYQSKLNDAVISESTDIAAMTDLLERMEKKGFYTIARVSAFRDRSFGDTHVTSGLYMLSRAGLWMDKGGMYWLDPTNATTTSWITSVVLELRDMGFDEVLLTDFCFPDTDQIIFNGDKSTALQEAASKLMSTCSSQNFTLSFCVDDPTFALPDGRCRMYLQDVNAAQISTTASKVTFEDPEIRLVFLSETGDTRYDGYSVLRSINVAEEVEARKANQS